MRSPSSLRQMYPSSARLYDLPHSACFAPAWISGALAYPAQAVPVASCAAYRRSAYEAVGGFAASLPTNEDMLIASVFLKEGWRLAYCADAAVLHSHNFTFRQEYLRNRQVGRFLARYASCLGGGELGEGMRMVRTVSLQLLRGGHVWECAAFTLNCAARLLGSRAGRHDEARQQRRQSRTREV